MKIDTSGIDRAQLAQRIGAEYGLAVVSLTFVPKGEDAYHYIAEEQDGARHFVRAQPAARARDLETAFAITSALRSQRGLRQVVAPYQSHRGTFTCLYGDYTLAVFPFVEGVSGFEVPLSDDSLVRTAALVATIHRSARSLAIPPHRRETFENPFSEPILRALRSTREPDAARNDYQRRVRQLLQAEQTDILATLDMMERWKSELRLLDVEDVLTHGDPNTANIMVDSLGGLHLVDWDEVALGPPERDVIFFTEERFELFLHHYVAAFGALRLHAEIFRFYQYRWALQEIADYSTRILFRNTLPEEDQHAWAELTDYLPIRHRTIQDTVHGIKAMVSKVLGN